MKLKPTTAFFAVVCAFLVTMWSGCATTFPYAGHEATPIVEDVPYRHVNSIDNPQNPYWETYHIVTIKNPLNHGVSFDFDCHKHEKESWISVDVPAHTAQKVLITPDQGSCEIHRVPQRFAPMP